MCVGVCAWLEKLRINKALYLVETMRSLLCCLESNLIMSVFATLVLGTVDVEVSTPRQLGGTLRAMRSYSPARSHSDRGGKHKREEMRTWGRSPAPVVYGKVNRKTLS